MDTYPRKELTNEYSSRLEMNYPNVVSDYFRQAYLHRKAAEKNLSLTSSSVCHNIFIPIFNRACVHKNVNLKFLILIDSLIRNMEQFLLWLSHFEKTHST